MALYVSIYNKPAPKITVGEPRIPRAGFQSAARPFFLLSAFKKYISELGVMGPLCRVGSSNVIINVTYFIKESVFLPQSISYRHLDLRGWHDILSDKLKTKYSILLPLKIFKSCSYLNKQMNTLATMSAIRFCFCIKINMWHHGV